METKDIVNQLDDFKSKGGFSNTSLAEKLGCSRSYLSEVLSRKKQPGAELVLSLQRLIADTTPPASTTASDLCRAVELYHMVSAGPGSEPEWSEPVGTEVIPVRLLAPSIKPVLVKGRSMEPAIMDKAVIGVDTSDKRVVSGEVYAVLLPYEGAVVKRLYIQKDWVLIRSDNKEFPEEKLSEEEIGDSFVLGRVKWILQEL